MTTLLTFLRLRAELLRCAASRRREAGLSTLEIAVIAVGVLGLAIALVTVLTTAVESRLDEIQ